MRDIFRLLAERSAHAVGSPWAFLAASSTVILWALAGSTFGYSDTWQLFINTGTTIVTFLMVFLIQNTQNRDTRVVSLKLDELLRAITDARTELVGLDQMSEEDLEQVQKEFERLQETYAPLVDTHLARVTRELSLRKSRR